VDVKNLSAAAEWYRTVPVCCLSQESRYSKMEKADILEMTVAHLKFVHSSRYAPVDVRCRGASEVPSVAVHAPGTDDVSTGTTTTTAAALRYLVGYNECVREVASYLAGDDGDAAARRLGDDVRASLMRHLDDCLRLRATAPVVAVARLPSVLGGSCGGGPVSDPRSPDARACSPPSVDSAGDTPWRQRCDSGVYSGASSPAHADELAVGAVVAAVSLPSPLELTTRTAHQPTSTSTCPDASQLQQPLQTLNVDTSAEVWRPW